MLLVAIIFILLGILIKYGKMYFLIAGYNTMSKEAKANYNVESIATLMKNIMFVMAFIMILGHFVAKWLDKPDIEIIFMFIAFLIGIPYLLIKANTDKYKTN